MANPGALQPRALAPSPTRLPSPSPTAQVVAKEVFKPSPAARRFECVQVRVPRRSLPAWHPLKLNRTSAQPKPSSRSSAPSTSQSNRQAQDSDDSDIIFVSELPLSSKAEGKRKAQSSDSDSSIVARTGRRRARRDDIHTSDFSDSEEDVPLTAKAELYSDDDSGDEFSPGARTPRQFSPRGNSTKKRRKSEPSAGPRKSGGGELEYNATCHATGTRQDDRPHMTCVNFPECRTKWCDICIYKRYTNETYAGPPTDPWPRFVAGGTLECPACRGVCTCKKCRVKRGEALAFKDDPNAGRLQFRPQQSQPTQVGRSNRRIITLDSDSNDADDESEGAEVSSDDEDRREASRAPAKPRALPTGGTSSKLVRGQRVTRAEAEEEKEEGDVPVFESALSQINRAAESGGSSVEDDSDREPAQAEPALDEDVDADGDSDVALEGYSLDPPDPLSRLAEAAETRLADGLVHSTASLGVHSSAFRSTMLDGVEMLGDAVDMDLGLDLGGEQLNDAWAFEKLLQGKATLPLSGPGEAIDEAFERQTQSPPLERSTQETFESLHRPEPPFEPTPAPPANRTNKSPSAGVTWTEGPQRRERRLATASRNGSTRSSSEDAEGEVEPKEAELISPGAAASALALRHAQPVQAQLRSHHAAVIGGGEAISVPQGNGSTAWFPLDRVERGSVYLGSLMDARGQQSIIFKRRDDVLETVEADAAHLSSHDSQAWASFPIDKVRPGSIYNGVLTHNDGTTQIIWTAPGGGFEWHGQLAKGPMESIGGAGALDRSRATQSHMDSYLSFE